MNLNIATTKLRSFFHHNKRLPSYSELCKLFNFSSKNAAYKLANKLIEAGYVARDSAGKLIPKNLFTLIPASGIVAAGFPSPAEEDMADMISLDEYLITRPEATFMLKVSGDSMIDAGIQPGDMVLVERGRGPKTGDVVVAAVDGQWTMKYFEKKDGIPVLVPGNKKYSTITPQESLELAGVVVSVVRKYH